MRTAALTARSLAGRPAPVRRSDHELIADCLSGKQRAWDELIERYQRLVASVPRRLGLAEADVEDVFQQVFLLLYRKLHTLRDCDRLASWLLTTAHRESWRAARRKSSFPTDELEHEATQVREDFWVMEERHLVRQALRELGGRCEHLLLALFSGPGQPNYRAIARDLGMKIGSIGPTRARCFRKLEKILLESGFSADGRLGEAVRRPGKEDAQRSEE